MQWCNIRKIVTDEILEKLKTIYTYSEVRFIDLRKFQYETDAFGELANVRVNDEKCPIDINMDDISTHKTSKKVRKFRIMDYPVSGMKKYHTAYRHRYSFAKEFLEADYIINIPKLKTHMKAGMTGAMKNVVGMISDKQCIPHHSKGSVINGGDCYKDFSVTKLMAENLFDVANQFIFTSPKTNNFIKKLGYKFLGLNKLLGGDGDISGSWPGNITLAHSIIDINRAIIYGDMYGVIKRKKQREIYSLLDAIVVGQNNGPLRPEPYNVGAIIFSDSNAAADILGATLLGFDFKKVLYIRGVLSDRESPLMDINNLSIIYNSSVVSIDDVKKM